jgi:hypothetical protein
LCDKIAFGHRVLRRELSGSVGPRFDTEGVGDHLGNRQSWLSFSFGIAAIVFVTIDLFADNPRRPGTEPRLLSSGAISGLCQPRP